MTYRQNTCVICMPRLGQTTRDGVLCGMRGLICDVISLSKPGWLREENGADELSYTASKSVGLNIPRRSGRWAARAYYRGQGARREEMEQRVGHPEGERPEGE